MLDRQLTPRKTGRKPRAQPEPEGRQEFFADETG
jgi:hypothetical protein